MSRRFSQYRRIHAILAYQLFLSTVLETVFESIDFSPSLTRWRVFLGLVGIVGLVGLVFGAVANHGLQFSDARFQFIRGLFLIADLLCFGVQISLALFIARVICFRVVAVAIEHSFALHYVQFAEKLSQLLFRSFQGGCIILFALLSFFVARRCRRPFLAVIIRGWRNSIFALRCWSRRRSPGDRVPRRRRRQIVIGECPNRLGIFFFLLARPPSRFGHRRSRIALRLCPGCTGQTCQEHARGREYKNRIEVFLFRHGKLPHESLCLQHTRRTHPAQRSIAPAAANELRSNCLSSARPPLVHSIS